jgi:hypothetical protein
VAVVVPKLPRESQRHNKLYIGITKATSISSSATSHPSIYHLIMAGKSGSKGNKKKTQTRKPSSTGMGRRLVNSGVAEMMREEREEEEARKKKANQTKAALATEVVSASETVPLASPAEKVTPPTTSTSTTATVNKVTSVPVAKKVAALPPAKKAQLRTSTRVTRASAAKKVAPL